MILKQTDEMMIYFSVFVVSLSYTRFVAGQLCRGVNGPICCAGFWLNTSTKVCEVCPIGYLGFNCSKKCAYPSYGKDCQQDCRCEKHLCHHSHGCIAFTKSSVSSDGWGTTSSARVLQYITKDVSQKIEPNITITPSTYNPDISAVNTSFVVYIGIILIGLFVLFFGLFVVTYVYQKCTRQRADMRNVLENNIIDQFVQYKTLSFATGEQEFMLNREQRERLKSDPTYLSPVFDCGTPYQEVEARNDPATENILTSNDVDETTENEQETIPQSNEDREPDLTPESASKHVYVEIMDDKEEDMFENKRENFEDINNERRSPDGRESGYVNS